MKQPTMPALTFLFPAILPTALLLGVSIYSEKKVCNLNILLYFCTEKLRKECNLLEMSVG